jgi:RNA recognition motif-containing protein
MIMTRKVPKRALHRCIQPFGDERRRHVKGIEVPGRIDLVTPTSTSTSTSTSSSISFWWDDNPVPTSNSESIRKDASPKRSTLGQRAAAMRHANAQVELLTASTDTAPVEAAPRPPRPPTSIRIDQLPLETTEIDLWNLCRSYGNLESIYIARDTRDRDNPLPQGFAVLTFSKADHASSAVQALEGMPWNGWVLHSEIVV